MIIFPAIAVALAVHILGINMGLAIAAPVMLERQRVRQHRCYRCAHPLMSGQPTCPECSALQAARPDSRKDVRVWAACLSVVLPFMLDAAGIAALLAYLACLDS